MSSTFPAIILAGGKGARLGELTRATPKPMLEVAGCPFVEYLLWNLKRQGITDIVFSVGYLAGAFSDYFANGAAFGVRIRYACEEAPLGTGGGIKLASQMLGGPFYVLNGDTILDCDLAALHGAALKTSALAGVALRNVSDVGRYAAVTLRDDGKIAAFNEKTDSGPGLINGGVYWLTPEAVKMLPEGASSIETALFPALAEGGSLAGLGCAGFFLDIGLPETYAAAQCSLPAWRDALADPFVFLDRDGTLIVEKNYLHKPEEVEVLPGVAEGLRHLQALGARLLVVTNQSGIGRGYYSEADMHAVNARLQTLLCEQGVNIEKFYFCPHRPEEKCDCRKPKTGMFRQACRDFAIGGARNFMIGDKLCDLEFGVQAGLKSVLVRTGYGRKEEGLQSGLASHVADNLAAAAAWLAQFV